MTTDLKLLGRLILNKALLGINSRPVVLLGAILVGVILGAPTTTYAATTLFDRTGGVTAQSDVSVSSQDPAGIVNTFASGSLVSLSSAFSPTQYTAMVSSYSGQAFSNMFPIGDIDLLIYKSNGASYDLMHTVSGAFATILGVSAGNLYGDSVTPLVWDISGIELAAGQYVFSSFQYQAATENQAMYLNFVAPGLGSLSDWTAVAAPLNQGNVPNPASFSGVFSTTSAEGNRHFADKLVGNMVPEPAVSSLLALGMAAVLMRRRRGK